MPILIGITGRRELTPKEVESVKNRLAATFKRLDKEFPRASKVLLTGGAYGADTIAAELVVPLDKNEKTAFPNWSVVVILPFDKDLFEKDFRASASATPGGGAVELAAERLEHFRALVAASERVGVRTLPPLSGATSGEPVEREELDKDSPQHNQTVRHNHYEQVGQFIAEAATLLIAVMDGETVPKSADANGSTDRVVAYRREGRPDRQGMAVANKSTVLRRDWGALFDPPAEYVWLIEPDRPSKTADYPVIVLEPTPETDTYTKSALSVRAIGSTAERERALRASLAMLRACEQFRHHADRRAAREALERKVSSVLSPWLPGSAWIASLASTMAPLVRNQAARGTSEVLELQPPDAIVEVRRMISKLQADTKSAASVACRAIAVLFVFAVFFLESYVDLSSNNLLLFGYLLTLSAIFALIMFVRWRRWQPLSEDYRTVNEMLRIQRVWWSAGLADRVDHQHLQAVDAELARVRNAVRTFLAWIWIRSDWPTARPPCTDWAHVRGAGSERRRTDSLAKGNTPIDWIGSQIHYFANNHVTQDQIARRLDSAAWLLFAASFILAGLLLLFSSQDYGKAIVEKAVVMEASCLGPWPFVVSTTVLAAVALLVVWARADYSAKRALHHARRPHHSDDDRKSIVVGLVLFGLVISVSCAGAIQSGAIGYAGPSGVDAIIELAKELTIVTIVMLSALAGAIRYVLEKLNFAAQAQGYQDVLGRFERAERLMAQGPDGAPGISANESEARALIKDLAMIALLENEAWLKARRERPLNPP